MAITLRYLNRAEREWVAREVEGEIRRRGVVEQRNEWQIHQALVKLNVCLSELLVADVPLALHLSPEQMGTLMPVIVSSSRNEPERRKLIAHELAHELMREWVAPALFDTDTVICTDQDNRVTRQRIAQRVERAFEEE